MRYLRGLVVLALLVAPFSVLAEGESISRLEAMEARLMALEDKLAASEATVAAQRDLLRTQGAVNAGTQGGIMGQMAKNLWISGAAQIGYAYNFRDPDQNVGGIGFGPQADDNSFNFDEARLLVEWGVEQPGDAGAVIELAMGETAKYFSGNDTISEFFDERKSYDDIYYAEAKGLDDDNILAAQAYVQWMCGCGLFQLGKKRAPVGTQSPFTSENAHIFHTYSFLLMDPSFITGLYWERALTEQLTIGAVVHNGNDFIDDISDSKGILGWMTYTSSMSMPNGDPRYVFNVSYNHTADLVRTRTRTGMYVGDDTHPRQHVNANLLWNLTEAMYAQVEGGYAYQEGRTDHDGQQYSLWGSLVRLVGERAYVAARGEYFRDNNNLNACSAIDDPPCLGFFAHTDTGFPSVGNDAGTDPDYFQADEFSLWALTVTAGYWFNPSLLFRVEAGHTVIDFDGPEGDVGFEKYGERVDDELTYAKVAATFYFGGAATPPGRPAQ